MRRSKLLAEVNKSLKALEGTRRALSRRLEAETEKYDLTKRSEWSARAVVAAFADRCRGDERAVEVEELKNDLARVKILNDLLDAAERETQSISFEDAKAELPKHEARLAAIRAELGGMNADLTALEEELTALEKNRTNLEGRKELFGLFECMIGKPRNTAPFLTDTTATFCGRTARQTWRPCTRQSLPANKHRRKRAAPST